MSTGTGGGGPGGDGRRGGGVGPVTCESRHEPGSRHWQPAVTVTKKYLFAMASSNRHGVARGGRVIRPQLPWYMIRGPRAKSQVHVAVSRCSCVCRVRGFHSETHSVNEVLQCLTWRMVNAHRYNRRA